jgi:3-hydroxyacyl-CoA dehydrogenase/enoyl-CoA hydratase/carnithine racemase
LPDTVFHVRRVDTRIGPVAVVTVDNGEDHTRPTVLGRSAIESGKRALDQLESGDWRAAVVTGKPFVFVAGADIDEFPRATTAALASEGSRAGHELFGRIRALPYPTVAAVNGACVGGGVELALHCSARTISSAVRHFACPECFLGIFPAWGGTQLVPRLVGARTAVRFVVQNPMRQNRMLRAAEAYELGFADRLIEPVEFLDSSLAYAIELVERGGVDRQHADLSDVAEVVAQARASLDDTVHGAAPAPYVALDLIEGAATWTVEEGYLREEEALGELMPGPQAQASIYAYLAVERRTRRGAGVRQADPRRLRKVGIVGAGLMASQIAGLVLRRLEVPLAIRDLDGAIVERVVADVRGELAEAVGRGRLGEGKAAFLGSVVSGTTGWDGFEDCDLVLEAVIEDPAVKGQVLAEARAVAPRAILATNTSSLSVEAMGADVGLHFFNPVALMPLLEIVRHPGTPDEALATAWDVCGRLGKRGVVVADAPGFVVNRVLTRFLRSLLDALEHGAAADEVDEAVLSLGMPMAPSVLIQLVGPRVANHVLDTLHEAFPDRFPPSPALEAIARGEEPPVRERRAQTSEEIVDAALLAVADEIRHLLDDGVVERVEDVDAALILGAGWPFWLGGATKELERRFALSF